MSYRSPWASWCTGPDVAPSNLDKPVILLLYDSVNTIGDPVSNCFPQFTAVVNSFPELNRMEYLRTETLSVENLNI